ncbi:hypothetical protein Tcan_13643 [Toxocara canis]|uniref:Uncharacterized protein n=1 Tax=Toxocara canis TaxID=6265 RepID=A0A0B2VJX0_TOXCA|nr:hypothetical protein Tcan_13643 [Toxocara canis]
MNVRSVERGIPRNRCPQPCVLILHVQPDAGSRPVDLLRGPAEAVRGQRFDDRYSAYEQRNVSMKEKGRSLGKEGYERKQSTIGQIDH